MLFSLACLVGFLTLICSPGLIAQARAEHAQRTESEAV